MRRLSAVLLCAVALSGCGSLRNLAGLQKKSPDEFAVTTKAPLVIPPDFSLRPPIPGAPPANSVTPAATAEQLAFETVKGSIKLLEASGEDPEKLRDAVTSPGGTTEAALKVFKAHNFRQTFADAVAAARTRSIELARL